MEKLKEKAKYTGIFEVECYRDGKLIWREITSNIVTDEGLTHMLAVTLTGKTLIEPFYCVMSNTDETAVAGMTYQTPVYVETTAYDEATRPIYVDVITNKSVTNADCKAVFTIDATETMYGAALVGGSAVKSNQTSAATHVLLCYSKFGTARAVIDNDVINLTYTVVAADDA